jgi:hypothetical protein
MAGVALSFLIGGIIKLISKIYFNDSRKATLKGLVESTIQLTKYKLVDYFSSFFKQLA